MNGRIYDPTLGRFLQADPHIQAPENSQSFNRYSYVLNNPLSYTDPSGYSFSRLFKKIGKNVLRAAAKIFGAEVVGILGNIASFACGLAAPVCAAYFNYEFTRALGGSSSQALRGAFTAAATTFAFQQIGGHFKGVSGGQGANINFGGNLLKASQVAQQIAAHAIVGGIGAELQGGKFGHGFFAAGVAKGFGGAFLPGGGQIDSFPELVANTTISAVIGGTASVISGGKFANGARTGAMQYLFNQANNWVSEKIDEQLAKRTAARRVNAIDAELEKLSGLVRNPKQLRAALEGYGFEGDSFDLRAASLSINADLISERAAALYVVVNGLGPALLPNAKLGKTSAFFGSSVWVRYVKASPVSFWSALQAWPILYLNESPNFTAAYSCRGKVCGLQGLQIHE